MIIILWTFAQPVTVNSCFLKRASQDALTSVNIPLSTNQTTSLQKNHASTEYVNPLTLWKSTLSPLSENISSFKGWCLTSTAPSLNEHRLWISSSEWWKCPFAKFEMLKFHFLLGLCLLGAGVEEKEGSVTAEEQMKSTFIPKLMSVMLSPIC